MVPWARLSYSSARFIHRGLSVWKEAGSWFYWFRKTGPKYSRILLVRCSTKWDQSWHCKTKVCQWQLRMLLNLNLITIWSWQNVPFYSMVTISLSYRCSRCQRNFKAFCIMHYFVFTPKTRFDKTSTREIKGLKKWYSINFPQPWVWLWHYLRIKQAAYWDRIILAYFISDKGTCFCYSSWKGARCFHFI